MGPPTPTEWLAVALLAGAPALLALAWGATGPDAVLAAALGTVAVAGLLPVPGGRPGLGHALAFAVLTALAATAWIAVLLAPPGWPQSLGLAGAMAILILALTSLRGLLAGALGDAPAALLVVALLATAAAAPLWLAAVAEHAPAGAHLASAAAGITPLGLLAAAMGHDYLHGDWWYRHSPLAALPYRQPALIGWLAVCAGLTIVTQLRQHRITRQSALPPAGPVFNRQQQGSR